MGILSIVTIFPLVVVAVDIVVIIKAMQVTTNVITTSVYKMKWKTATNFVWMHLWELLPE